MDEGKESQTETESNRGLRGSDTQSACVCARAHAHVSACIYIQLRREAGADLDDVGEDGEDELALDDHGAVAQDAIGRAVLLHHDQMLIK